MTWDPGPKSRTLLDEFHALAPSHKSPKPFVVDVAKSDGMWLTTIDGRRIFDWACYYASKLIAHNHPRLSEPNYVARLVACANNKVANNDFVTPELIAYYETLQAVAPKCMASTPEIMTLNSGAEAVENMLKYLINLHREKRMVSGREPKRPKFIFFDRAFHGRSIYTLNLTDMPHNPIVTRDYHGLVAEKNIMVPWPEHRADDTSAWRNIEVSRCLTAMEQALLIGGESVAGIIAEPMQGAGGHRLAMDGFFAGVSRLAYKYSVPLCFDEVQTAGGQTGAWFMCDQLGLPHPVTAVATAKKFGCGVVFMGRPMKDTGILDSTWNGTLVDMVRFTQEARIVKDEMLIEAVPAKTSVLVNGLRALALQFPNLISNVRGVGLYQGFSVRPPLTKKQFAQVALELEDLLLLDAGQDSIRLRPHLNVTEPDIDVLLSKLYNVLAHFSTT